MLRRAYFCFVVLCFVTKCLGGFKWSLHHEEGYGAMGSCKYNLDDWRAVRKALAAGGTIRGVAEETGVGYATVFRWGRMDEAPERTWLMLDIDAAPAPEGARKKGAALGYGDRVMIYMMRRDGRTHREIADAVGCHRTTVGRELRRMPEGRYVTANVISTGFANEGLPIAQMQNRRFR